LEEWVGGTVGQSPCCDMCGSYKCRKVEMEGENLIVKAGLLTASKLIDMVKNEPCCGNSSSRMFRKADF
jgi:hypothetical protein